MVWRTKGILPESPDRQARRRARGRISAIDRRCRIAREADRLMPLSLFYSTRWPRWVT
jgi:hypothetical protein